MVSSVWNDLPHPVGGATPYSQSRLLGCHLLQEASPAQVPWPGQRTQGQTVSGVWLSKSLNVPSVREALVPGTTMTLGLGDAMNSWENSEGTGRKACREDPSHTQGLPARGQVLLRAGRRRTDAT